MRCCFRMPLTFFFSRFVWGGFEHLAFGFPEKSLSKTPERSCINHHKSNQGGSSMRPSYNKSVLPFLGLILLLVTVFTASAYACLPPEGNCTYTQGFWMAHSIYGPASDACDGWYTNFGPNPPGAVGPDAPLFDSGLTWLEVLSSPARKGNAWFILAHHWMAAYLNYYNGAGTGGTDVVLWLAEAAALLDTYDQYDGGTPLIPKGTADRDYALQLAEWLAEYCAGYIGPGQCVE